MTVIGVIIVALVMLVSLYSGIPWASKDDVRDLRLRVDGIDLEQKARSTRIARLEAINGEWIVRLDRMERKIDSMMGQHYAVP